MSNKNEHTNEIAKKLLRAEYSDYEYNWWHYNEQYKMLVKAQTEVWKQANEAADNHDKALNLPCVNGRLTPKVGFIYYIGDYTAPKVFNGLYYECLLTDQRIASHEEIKVDTGVKITAWEHDIYKPERFGLRY